MSATASAPPPGSPVPRPKTGQMDLQHLRVAQDDWDDLGALLGRERAEVARSLLRWYLRRPGARLPERPTQDQVTEVERRRILGGPNE